MELRLATLGRVTASLGLCGSLGLVSPSRGIAQDTCILDADQAGRQAHHISDQFTDPDPLWRRRLGLPDTVVAIDWSQDAALCAEALRHFRRVGDSLGWEGHPRATTNKVLVFLVEPAFMWWWGDGDRNALSFFDRQWRYLVTLVGLN